MSSKIITLTHFLLCDILCQFVAAKTMPKISDKSTKFLLDFSFSML